MVFLKKIISLLALTFSLGAYAQCDFCNDKPWTIEANLGFSFFKNTGVADAHTSLGRLSIGYTLLNTNWFLMGLEGGVQNGTHLRLIFPMSDIQTLGGVPIDAEIKPMMDVLMVFKTEAIAESPLYLWGKFGGAYRQLRLDRDSVNDVTKISPEILLGLGWHINKQVSFTLGYQYLSGSKPVLVVYPELESGFLRNIPLQQSVMFGFSINFL